MYGPERKLFKKHSISHPEGTINWPRINEVQTRLQREENEKDVIGENFLDLIKITIPISKFNLVNQKQNNYQ